MPKLSLDDLKQLYTDATSVDEEIFAEQRSNILLIAGDHYSKKKSQYWNRLRNDEQIPKDQRLRLTKNHIQYIVKKYVNSISNYAPGVMLAPQNEQEIQDQKAAQLHQAVWEHLKRKYRLKSRNRDWVEDYCGVGEVAVKIFFDPNKGEVVGYHPAVDEQGVPILDELGQPTQSDKPIFRGEFVYETIYGFNLLRPKSAKNLDDAPWLGLRKMMPTKELKAFLDSSNPDHQQILKTIHDSQDETYVIFDGLTGAYSQSDGMTMVTEFFFRPCSEYPRGYYYMNTPSGKLFEGELPSGIFPIAYGLFEKYPTSSRGRSLVKQLRPYQAEINRAASKMAEHQVTLGDDKLLIQKGTKLEAGGQLPGVRGVMYSGMKPEILAGRDGSQYLQYMQSQIAEMYQIAGVTELDAEKGGQLDAHTLLYRSMRERAKYSLHIERYEEFLSKVCEISLELARSFLPEDEVIQAVGSAERVNISEFKNSSPLGYQIKLEAVTEDPETKLGKQIFFQQVLQYVGTQLSKEEIGRILRSAPYGNSEEGFEDFTRDYDNAKNMLLALDRGQQPMVSPFDDPVYMEKALMSRMRKADFFFLPPQVQQLYQEMVEHYRMLEQENQKKIIAAKSEYLPVGGAMVACDIYVNDKMDPTKAPKRARVPYQALEWLLNKLEAQGMGLEKLEQMNSSQLAEIVSGVTSGQPPMMSVSPGQGGSSSLLPQDRGRGVANVSRANGSAASGPARQPGFPSL